MNGTKSRDHYLTRRQMEVLSLEREGLSPEEIAHRIGRTVQDVYIIDKRIKTNVRKAQNTISLYEDAGVSVMIHFKPNSELLDILREIVRGSDEAGIKLGENLIGLLTILRQSLRSDINDGRVTRRITVMIRRDGSLKVY
jgi:Tfx family DNA-binding protein